MTPEEKAGALAGLYDELNERCEMMWMMNREDPDSDQPSAAVAAMILADGGDLLIIEAGVSADGDATVTVRLFDCDMKPADAQVFATGNSVLISTA